jgi:putative two-component system response regulator
VRSGCRASWKNACADVDRLRDATLHVMVSFAEFRDEDTGNHVRRTQEYVRTLARWLA